MTLKEFVETNEKINEYKESGKLTIELASDLDEELNEDFNLHEERMKFHSLLKEQIALHAEIEAKLSKLINMFENLQEQVNSLEISTENIVL